MSEQAYDSRAMTQAAPQRDGLLGALDMQLDRLDQAIARIQDRLFEVTGPDFVERAVAVPDEPLTPGRKRVVRLGDLIDALNRTTDRLDI